MEITSLVLLILIFTVFFQFSKKVKLKREIETLRKNIFRGYATIIVSYNENLFENPLFQKFLKDEGNKVSLKLNKREIITLEINLADGHIFTNEGYGGSFYNFRAEAIKLSSEVFGNSGEPEFYVEINQESCTLDVELKINDIHSSRKTEVKYITRFPLWVLSKFIELVHNPHYKKLGVTKENFYSIKLERGKSVELISQVLSNYGFVTNQYGQFENGSITVNVFYH